MDDGERGLLKLANGQHLFFVDGKAYLIQDVTAPNIKKWDVTNKQLANGHKILLRRGWALDSHSRGRRLRPTSPTIKTG